MRATRLLAIWALSCLFNSAVPTATAQPHPSAELSAPAHPQGRSSPDGLIVSSTEDGFAVLLRGHSFQPASADKLQWDVDGFRVELSVLRKPRLGSWSPREALLEFISVMNGMQIETPEANAQTPKRQRKLWSTADAEFAATDIPAGLLVIRVATAGHGGRSFSRNYARQAILSVDAVADSRPATRLETGDEETGAPLPGMLRLRRAITGVRAAALINRQLATPIDLDLAEVLPMDAGTLADFARWELGLGDMAIQVVVFDGRVGHAINLMSYDATLHAFVYFDPWGKGSFLEAGNNAAGVAAKAHPTQPRMWVLPFSSMERVLYALINDETSLIETLNLCALAYAPAQRVFDAYAPAGERPALDPALLEQRVRHLYAVEHPDAAGAMLAARYLSSPSPVPADLLNLAHRNGLTDLAAYAARLQRGPDVPPTVHRTMPAPTLKSVQSSDLFTFFRLQLTYEQAGQSRFRSSSPQFGPLAEVVLYTDAAGVITRSELIISRSFISTPDISPFAADLVKSYIMFATDPAEQNAVKPLALEIFGRRAKPVLIPGATHPESTVKAVLSPGAQAYYGSLQSYRQVLPASVLDMHSAGAGKQAALHVSVSPR